nr:hypothetical protein [Clostridia bacterium]
MANKDFYTPNDEGIIAEFDAVSVQNAIDAAAKSGCGKVVIPRMNARTGGTKWEFDRTVYIPSDMTLILDNCFIYLADGVFCNVFCNSNIYTELGKTLEGEQHDIRILGIGNAVVDGGKYNGLHERNSLKDGMPHISLNTPFLFSNVRNFEVAGFRVSNQRWWGMTYVFCRNGHIHDLEFQADQSGKDPETGERRPDIIPKTWGDYYIRNADGVDLRIGCNNITIENITGFTQDDTVALTALTGFEKNVFVEEKPTDICRVFIKNIVSNSANCANIRLTCGDGNKIHDIFIDGMIDTSAGKPYRASAAIRIDNHRYGKTKKAAHGDMTNVSINNVSTRAKAAVEVVGTVMNLA